MSSYAVVVGGANLDLKARSAETVVGATSNPGTTRFSPGGVGRNVAENLARLGTPVQLVSAIGADRMGQTLLGATTAAGVGTQHVRRDAERTGSYTAVFSPDGELVVAVADMAAIDALAPADVPTDVLAAAAVVILDGNLLPDTMAAAWDAATAPVLLDPVSVPKARRVVDLLDRGRPLHTITPNRDELAALSGTDDLAGGCDWLHERGIERVWVRLGAEGSMLSTRGDRQQVQPVGGSVVDVTGAGDAMLAAYAHGLLEGLEALAAAELGQRAAALTVASEHTVHPGLREELLERTP